MITGAASGIGRAVALRASAAGQRILAVDRDGDGLDSLRAEADGPVVTASLDVTDAAGLNEAVKQAQEQLGPIDRLIVSAGISDATFLQPLDVESIERLIRVNYLGLVATVDTVLPGMLARGEGRIAGVASLAGCRGMPFSAGYSASKAAVIRYLEGLRPPLRRRGIYLTTVLPGFVATPLMERAAVRPPVKMITPDRAARAILRAVDRRKRVCRFPLDIDLSVQVMQWMPAWLFDRLMALSTRQMPELKY